MERNADMIEIEENEELDEAESLDTSGGYNLKRFDNRAGFRLADIVEVALPVYSINVNALTLAHKPISPIDEFVLRCIGMNMSQREELVSFLGLADEVIRPVLASLAQSEQIALT